MTTWEYKVRTFSYHENAPAVLNELGESGWELVTLFPVGKAPPYPSFTMYFKRPIHTYVDTGPK